MVVSMERFHFTIVVAIGTDCGAGCTNNSYMVVSMERFHLTIVVAIGTDCGAGCTNNSSYCTIMAMTAP
jgi:imidazolonepropionase-like amidohydrolase